MEGANNMFFKVFNESEKNTSEVIKHFKKIMESTQAVVIGAGAGLSASSGFEYDGETFGRYFFDFEKKYGFHDMYSGGFYPFETFEEQWAFWSRNIYINRYQRIPKSVYDDLYSAVKNKDYFVITTNVDHCFQKAGFAKKRLFYTQGDYGLWQCSKPCHNETYDNEHKVRAMLRAQGFSFDTKGMLYITEKQSLKMRIPSRLIPKCPICGRPMSMNLRSDSTFVENNSWHEAYERYMTFLRNHRKSKILFLELGVGMNTPGIIKYPFWQMAAKNHRASYACINQGEAVCPENIVQRATCINDDIGKILKKIA